MATEAPRPEAALEPFSPVTQSIAFIEASFSELRQALIDRYVGINQRAELDWTVTWDDLEGDLATKMSGLLPLSSLPTRTMVSATTSRWCAVFGNEAFGGSDVNSAARPICRALKKVMVTVVLARDVRGGAPGSVQFQYHDYTGETTRVRGIAAHKESRWEFEAYGEPLPFEELETYEEKQIKDRLTFEQVGRYCQALGIDVYNAAYYTGPAVVVKTYPPPATRFFDSFEAGRRPGKGR